MSVILGCILLALCALGAVAAVRFVASEVTRVNKQGPWLESEPAVSESFSQTVGFAALLALPTALALYLVGVDPVPVIWWAVLTTLVALTVYLLLDLTVLRHASGKRCGLRALSVGHNLFREALGLTEGLTVVAYASLAGGLWVWAIPGVDGWVRGTAAGVLVAAAVFGATAKLNARRLDRMRWDSPGHLHWIVTRKMACEVAVNRAIGFAVVASIVLAGMMFRGWWTGTGD